MRRSDWLLRTVLFCCASLFPWALAEAAAGSRWQLIEDSEDIRVWSLEIPGRDLPGFRGITKINAGIEQIMNYMLDAARHPDWMYNCDESRIVKRYDATHSILYNRINAPWPVHDRDVLLDVVHRYTPQRTAVTFRFRTTTEFAMPVPRRVIRIPRLEGFYRLWQDTPTRTNVLYQVEVDIGGNVPDRLARRYARNLPFVTLERLREKLELGRD